MVGDRPSPTPGAGLAGEPAVPGRHHLSSRSLLAAFLCSDPCAGRRPLNTGDKSGATGQVHRSRRPETRGLVPGLPQTPWCSPASLCPLLGSPPPTSFPLLPSLSQVTFPLPKCNRHVVLTTPAAAGGTTTSILQRRTLRLRDMPAVSGHTGTSWSGGRNPRLQVPGSVTVGAGGDLEFR